MLARQTVVRAVKEAGRLQLAGRASVAVEAKGDHDVVTNVDHLCEATIAEILHATHPDHSLLAEEGTARAGREHGPCWVLDPLDGTKNYAHGSPRFACSLALLWDGLPLLGAVYAPQVDELFFAQQGHGATLNGAALRVSAVPALSAALVGTALTVTSRPDARQLRRVERLTPKAQGLRIGGCASLDLCDVARGRLDAYFEEGLSPWDTAAGALIVREAGGVVTTFAGAAHDLFGAETLAATPKVGAALVSLLKEA